MTDNQLELNEKSMLMNLMENISQEDSIAFFVQNVEKSFIFDLKAVISQITFITKRKQLAHQNVINELMEDLI